MSEIIVVATKPRTVSETFATYQYFPKTTEELLWAIKVCVSSTNNKEEE